MSAGLIFVGVIIGLVLLVTFGAQLILLLIYLAVLIGGFVVQAVMALGWCVFWVFKREAAMEAWRKSRG